MSLCSRAWEPQLLSPVPQLPKPECPRAHALQQEKPPQWEPMHYNWRLAPLAGTREKPKQQSPSTTLPPILINMEYPVSINCFNLCGAELANKSWFWVGYRVAAVPFGEEEWGNLGTGRQAKDGHHQVELRSFLSIGHLSTVNAFFLHLRLWATQVQRSRPDSSLDIGTNEGHCVIL